MGRWVTSQEAVATLQPPDHVVLSPGCGEVLELERELARQHERLAGLTIYSGLLLSDYPFLVPEADFNYGTWHLMGPARKLVESGKADFYPISASRVVELFRGGELRADVAFIHVSPPDAHGYCSLGVSVSYPFSLSRIAKRVIAQVNPNMPRTHGRCSVHVSDIDLLVEVDEPLVEYPAPSIDEVSRTIGNSVAELIPEEAVVQIGIGAIPEAVVSAMAENSMQGIRMLGMGTDSMADLAEQGVLRPYDLDGAAVIGAELMGTTKLFEFAADNPLVEMHPAEFVLNAAEILGFDRLVSINSALQIDLFGQVNAEYIGGKQIGGIGGSFDFVQGARMSAGGGSILALPAADAKKRYSRIVAQLDAGTPVSVPRHYIETIVTEFGVAHLKGLSLRERAEALIAIADPDFRDELTAAASGKAD
jgi:4-hydroxybutyrate CoA-transferase